MDSSYPILQVTGITGLVTVNGAPVTRKQDLKEGDVIAVGKGGKCNVLLDTDPCMEITGDKVALLTLHWPPCLSTHTNCCKKDAQYEVFTPVGSVNVARDLATIQEPAC